MGKIRRVVYLVFGTTLERAANSLLAGKERVPDYATTQPSAGVHWLVRCNHAQRRVIPAKIPKSMKQILLFVFC